MVSLTIDIESKTFYDFRVLELGVHSTGLNTV
jgi:hypothetical protein